MDWNKLNSRERVRVSAGDPHPYDSRSNFESDYDRVVFSSAFRRMQDKTQAFPLEAHDFIRTRLTHSCEVAAIGRSLGISAANHLRLGPNQRDTNAQSTDFATIVATACLLHDIGNPPFGHSGEDSIRSWFKKRIKPIGGETQAGAATPEHWLSIEHPQERADLLEFEGNAQAFRIATRLQGFGQEFGMNLSCATLACLLKYPCSSTEGIKKDGPKAREKFGYFRSDSYAIKRVREYTGLAPFERHPLVLLMEAADDIAYSAADIEDALKKRVITFEFVVEYLRTALKGHQDLLASVVEPNLPNRLGVIADRVESLRERQQLAYQHFRAIAVGRMAGSCVEAFIANYPQIEAKTYHSELSKDMKLAPLCKALKTLARQHVYTDSAVVNVEFTGRHVIHGLLDIFVHELKFAPTSKLAKQVPSPPRNKEDLTDLSEDYQIAQRATDYVAGMTDTFALSLFRRLTGVST